MTKKILLLVLLAAFAMPIVGSVLGPTAAYAAIYLNYQNIGASDPGNDNDPGDEDQQ